MKKEVILISLVLLMSTISFSQTTSQTDKLTPKDFKDIFSLALNLKDLQKYYHINKDSSRSQIIFQQFGNANHNNLIGLKKFKKQVLIMSEDSLKKNNIKYYFVLGDWVCGTSAVRMQLSYVGEGLLISYRMERINNEWEITAYRLDKE